MVEVKSVKWKEQIKTAETTDCPNISTCPMTTAMDFEIWKPVYPESRTTKLGLHFLTT